MAPRLSELDEQLVPPLFLAFKDVLYSNHYRPLGFEMWYTVELGNLALLMDCNIGDTNYLCVESPLRHNCGKNVGERQIFDLACLFEAKQIIIANLIGGEHDYRFVQLSDPACVELARLKIDSAFGIRR